jgi:PAS domain S-box-containing protein
VNKLKGGAALDLGWGEMMLAGAALVGSIVAIAADGPWRWLALPCFAILLAQALKRSRRSHNQGMLRHTAGLLEMIGSSTPSIIYAKDRDGRMLYCNRALEQLSGVRMAAMLGKTDIEWNPSRSEAEALQAADREVLATGQTQDLEEAFTGKDGQTRIYQTLKSPLKDRSGEVIGVVGVSTDISDAREAEQREKLLSRELDHRAKNLLAVVQSIVSLTRAESLPEFKASLEGRVQALGRAHSMLAASRWEGADLERVLTEEFAPYRGRAQGVVQLLGPALLLKPAAAQSLALVIHELATNAAKYGALSVPEGELTVSWEIIRSAAGDPLLCIRWEEAGGPPVKPRTRTSRSGFGSRVIHSSIERQLGGALVLDWAPTGLVARMEVPVERSVVGGFAEGNDAPHSSD